MKNSIFLVHSWETGDGMHHLHVFEGDKMTTTNFVDWVDARNAAFEEAERRGLKVFQVDHPDFPHYWIEVRK